jgi:hypothetical protein
VISWCRYTAGNPLAASKAEQAVPEITASYCSKFLLMFRIQHLLASFFLQIDFDLQICSGVTVITR